jgi:dihydrofolate reductase
MQRLTVFNNISLDGYFVDGSGDMTWAHERSDDEWNEFAAQNASGGEGGQLLFGRITYDLMVAFWPTPAAFESNPTVAEQMNALDKVVYSRTMEEATWENTTLVTHDLEDDVRQRKAADGAGLVVMGSGTIVSQLAEAGLIDEFQFVINPVVLGQGRTLFETVTKRFDVTRTSERAFGNGNVVITYEPSAAA